MARAAHRAKSSSSGVTWLRSLFSSSKSAAHRGSSHVYATSNEAGAAVVVDDALAQKLEEVAPMTRQAIRLARLQSKRRAMFMTSTSLAALVGTATATMLLSNYRNAFEASLAAADTTSTTQLHTIDGSEVSRSQDRASLTTEAVSVNSDSTSTWSLGDSDSSLDLSLISSRIEVEEEVVEEPVAQPAPTYTYSLAPIQTFTYTGEGEPEGFNPNHATGDYGNRYDFSQCTWWAYIRRHQLGLPVGSYFGNGANWANSAAALGYWVDGVARFVGDIVVFAPGQAWADSTYGHVAIIESIGEDGSITISEMSASNNGVTHYRSFSAAEASQFVYIHY